VLLFLFPHLAAVLAVPDAGAIDGQSQREPLSLRVKHKEGDKETLLLAPWAMVKYLDPFCV
jgi:hypothetical protein